MTTTTLQRNYKKHFNHVDGTSQAQDDRGAAMPESATGVGKRTIRSLFWVRLAPFFCPSFGIEPPQVVIIVIDV